MLARNWEISRRTFAKNLHKVRHWEILLGDYSEAPDIEATWFIDPPYQGPPGMGYDFSSEHLDYENLASWILERRGQVVACAKAATLPICPSDPS